MLRHLLLIALLGWMPLAALAGELEELLWKAARQGDAATVQALLAKGVDVNTKFRYGATALSYACDRGHVEVVKVLLEHGADVNVKDTFYNATPLSWAAFKGHIEVIRLLLSKGAEGRDDAVVDAARQGKLELARVVLDAGGLKPETLPSALAAALRFDRKELVTALEQAGAKLPEHAVALDAAALARFAGAYRAETGTHFTAAIRDGRLYGGPDGQPPFLLVAVDAVTFRLVEVPAVSVTFRLEGEKSAGVVVKQGANETLFQRVEEKKP